MSLLRACLAARRAAILAMSSGQPLALRFLWAKTVKNLISDFACRYVFTKPVQSMIDKLTTLGERTAVRLRRYCACLRDVRRAPEALRVCSFNSH